MSGERQRLGRAAEDAAAAFLERAGLRVVERNVRFAAGEIDLVCHEHDVWVFVEVKARRRGWDDGPAAAVSWQKQRRLVQLAALYRKWRRITEARCRFDVVAVTMAVDGARDVRHIRSAFDATGS
ncbi:MAG: YraN family protein [Candidatus Rokubacteria bacterium]|nr:YraN family protein [Candidatus Rokubacteria bacterium]MBI3824625.1 YraN family protein [Candidatus Rokubacteria bacterium]